MLSGLWWLCLWLSLFLHFSLRLAFAPSELFAQTLFLESGSAVGEPSFADRNPANAVSRLVYLRGKQLRARYKHNVFIGSEVIGFRSFSMRYPDVPVIETGGASFGAGFSALYCYQSPRLRWGFCLSNPIVPIKLSQSFERIPLPILGELAEFRVDGEVETGFGLTMQLAAAVSPRLTFGLEVSTLDLAVQVRAGSVGESDELAFFRKDLQTVSVGWGVRFDMAKKGLHLALSGALLQFEQGGERIDVLEDSGLPPLSTSRTEFPILDRLTFGVLWRPGGTSFELAGDLRYEAAKPRVEFSVNEFRKKLRDEFDRLIPALSFRYRFNGRLSTLAAYSYTPAKLGDGSPGPTGRRGYSPLEAVQVYLGLSGLEPAHRYALGVQLKSRGSFSAQPVRKHSEKRKRRKNQKRASKPSRARLGWAVEMGVLGRASTRGIGESGEQPAAFVEESLGLVTSVRLLF